MAATIRLTILTGPHKGDRYCFRESSGTTLGRGTECDIRLCGADRDLCISRRHCQLTLNLPNVCVDDLGSANGTYVNGHRCVAAAQGATAHEVAAPIAAKDGDILTIGGTSLQISIMECQDWSEGEKIKKNCHVSC